MAISPVVQNYFYKTFVILGSAFDSSHRRVSKDAEAPPPRRLGSSGTRDAG